MRTLQSRRV